MERIGANGSREAHGGESTPGEATRAGGGWPGAAPEPTPILAEAASPAEAGGQPSWGTKLGAVGVITALLLKFKSVLLFGLGKISYLFAGAKLLSLGKFFGTGASMVLSMAFYATQFGLPFAIGFVLLIFVHEMGHVLALRWYGIRASVPIFIPFVGAFVALKEMPKNVYVEAVVGIAGPALGTAGALACVGAFKLGGGPIWLALGYMGFVLNLFNLLPILPLDGGRIAGAVSRWLWVAGLVGFGAFMVLRPSVVLLVLIAMSLPRLVHLFRLSEEEQEYYKVDPDMRFWMGCSYFGLAVLLAVAMSESHEILQRLARLGGG